MRKVAMIGMMMALLVVSSRVLAEENRDPAWTFQIGYAPAAAGGLVSWDDEASGIGGIFSPIGGLLSADWRSKGRWGVNIPVSFAWLGNSNERVPVIGAGVNAVLHFRKHGKKFDPYLMLGGKALIAVSNNFGKAKAVALPMPSVGFGMRYFLNKRVGLYSEVSAQGLPFPGGAIGMVQGNFGVSIRF